MQIPPRGSDPNAIATAIDKLVTETQANPHRIDWLNDAERGLNLQLGNHWKTTAQGGEIRVVEPHRQRRGRGVLGFGVGRGRVGF